MIDSYLQDLLRIGLTEGESKVYLSLIKLGSSTVGPIVKDSGVAYSNVYSILQRLIEKGIVGYITKNKTRYYQAVSPSNLYLYLEKKEKEITQQKKDLKLIIEKLNKLKIIKPTQEAKIFLGKKGLRGAYEELFFGATKRDENLFFYIHEEEYAQEADLFYFSMLELSKSIKLRGICNEEGRNSEFNKKATFMKIKYVNFPIPGNIEICKDKLLLVSWEKPVIAVLIHSKSLAENFRKYFNSVWKQAKT